MAAADTLARLPAKPVERILLALADLRQRQTAGEDVQVPLMTLQLRTGRELHGWILAMGQNADAGSVLMQLAAPDRSPAPDVAYTELSAIAAVTVHEAERSAPDLSFGAIAAPAGPVPNKLALRRKLAALGESLGAILGKALPCEADWARVTEDPEALRRMDTVISDVGAILRAAAATAVGVEALKGLERIVWVPGEKTVTRSGNVLNIPVPPAATPAIARGTLQSMIESQL